MTPYIFTETLLPLIYFMSLLSFIIWAYDKHRAVYHKWRIPEFLLAIVTVLGGAFGSLCGMVIFNHKCKKPLFYIGVPAILFIQIAIYVYLLTR